MPSSISSSERTATYEPPPAPPVAAPWLSPGRAAVVLLACATLLMVGVEVGTRAFIYDFSNVLNRMRQESRAAAQLQQTTVQPRPLLVVGNSLLVAGVDVAGLDTAVRPAFSVSRFAIENTTYNDWYYGLRRLMGEGARPGTVVLFFEPRHLLGAGVRDEIFGHYLMRLRDVFRVAGAAKLTPTETSELMFANVSDFGGLRYEIRKNLLGRLFPALPSLTAMMTRGTPAPPADTAALRTTGVERMKALRAVTEPHGVRFILALMPPVTAVEAEHLRKLGNENGVIVIAPLTAAELQPGDYDRDGYHLSEQGRARFTKALARVLSASAAAER